MCVCIDDKCKPNLIADVNEKRFPVMGLQKMVMMMMMIMMITNEGDDYCKDWWAELWERILHSKTIPMKKGRREVCRRGARREGNVNGEFAN